MAYELTHLTKLSALQALAQRAEAAYAKKADLEELEETVQGIVSTGGEANVLEGVKVNGTALALSLIHISTDGRRRLGPHPHLSEHAQGLPIRPQFPDNQHRNHRRARIPRAGGKQPMAVWIQPGGKILFTR